LDDAGGVNPYEYLTFPGTGLLRLAVGKRLEAASGSQTNRLHAPLSNSSRPNGLRVTGERKAKPTNESAARAC
jgi:hypothetical protein